ncbi:MAG: endonuclease/exonuclease/phosphatase family protein [Bdellovibrionales bacterium]|nr:endonuclease/exonuclease/phosphatase family protein [Bdellovibrionales bacterium]
MSQNFVGLLKSTLVCSVLVYLSVSCTGPRKPVFTPGYEAPQNSITVMTYNVENLFDTQHDEGKNDETYLPLVVKGEKVKARCRLSNNAEFRATECMTKDWNDKVVAKKMRRLSDVLRQVKGGKGPDILLVQEVENRRVLEQFRTEHLSDLGYQPAILVEGPDERGIDVGLLTKLPVVDPVNYHDLKFTPTAELPAEKISATRGILEVTVRLPDETLMTVLVVHLPSQGSPTESRRQSLAKINKIKESLPKDRLVVVGGDFNISSSEENSQKLLTTQMMDKWGVSHFIGCNNCPGTYFYPREQQWSFFDVFLLSPNLLEEGAGPWKVITQSIRIENNSVYQSNKFGSPARFDERKKDGVSDHWPIAFEIIKR